MKLRSILTLRCPVCGKGKLFRHYLDTPDRCPECGFFFMRETGYFLPHAAIAYGATVLAAFTMWPLLWYAAGIRSDGVLLAAMVIAGLLFGLWFNRYAKMIWIVIDLKLHPPTREDFEPRGRT
jgi:uncharacterized protein (DUF983 family)